MSCLFHPFVFAVVEAECNTSAGAVTPICCLYPDIVWFVSWLFSSLFFTLFQHYALKVTLVIVVFFGVCLFFFLSLGRTQRIALLGLFTKKTRRDIMFE